MSKSSKTAKNFDNSSQSSDSNKNNKNLNLADMELEELLSNPSKINNFDVSKCCDVLDLFKNLSDKRTINKFVDIIDGVSKNIRKIAAKVESMENMHNILKEIKEGINNNCSNNNNHHHHQHIPSFSQIVQRESSNHPQFPQKSEEKTIIVKSNNNVAPQIIESKIKSLIKQSNKKTKINKIFSKRNCVVIKTVNNESTYEDLINQINSNNETKNDCTAYCPKMRDPTIMLKNVSTDTDLLNLNQQIVDCNEELAAFKDEIKFLFKMKYGDHTAKHMNIVLRVSPNVHHIITNTLNNRIYLDYQCCYAQTKLFVRQCQKCFQFGHKTTDCHNHVICKGCGLEKQNNHTCSSILCCSNCKTSTKFNNNTAHSPNNEHCPIYKAQMERLYEQTNFHP
ncbi:uncharacterized protein LOC142645009 [Dermatophagoides pteronyssinus]|uniref:uncharacterized protein LOC142645009 n=1 Tax=Dermatophagoides pteronyssinus TaxID=6956 RepID=UPI003F66659F